MNQPKHVTTLRNLLKLTKTSVSVQKCIRFPLDAQVEMAFIKATSHLTIFMSGMRAKGKIQRNNYQYDQRRPSSAGKTSSVYLIAYLYAGKIAE